MKSLFIGYGNPIRSDDGVGIYLAEVVEKFGIPDLEVRTAHQLQIELAEDLAQVDRVIFADASSEGDEFALKKIDPSQEGSMSSSHHLDPHALRKLAGLLYKKTPEFYMCTVRGDNFDIGDRLSEAVLLRAKKASDLVRRILI